MTAPEMQPVEEPDGVVMNLRETRKEMAAAKRKADRAAAVTKREVAESAGTVEPPAKKPALKAVPAPKPEVLRDAEHPWYTKKSYTAKEGHKLYEATGTSGQIAVRSFKEPVYFAVNLIQPNMPGERGEPIRKGTIFHMYATREAAEKVAEKMSQPPTEATVVEVREYQGP